MRTSSTVSELKVVKKKPSSFMRSFRLTDLEAGAKPDTDDSVQPTP